VTRINLRGERGFTLIELMVATFTGVIVSGATLAIVITSVHLTSNYTDRVDATQEGRTAMAKITQLLDSSCVAPALSAILPNAGDTNNTISATSGDSALWFYSSLSDGPTVLPSLVEIHYTGSSLVMSTYANTSALTATPPNWSFATTPTSFTLLPYATQESVSGSALPVFQYYGYGSNQTMSTTAFGTPLSNANAAATAMVTVNFEALPSDNWSGSSAAGRPASFSDSIVLRLSPASSTSSNPCS